MMMFWLMLVGVVGCVLNAGFALSDRNYYAVVGWLHAGGFALANFLRYN